MNYNRQYTKAFIWVPFTDAGRRFRAGGPARSSEHAWFDTRADAAEAWEEYREHTEGTVYLRDIRRLIVEGENPEHAPWVVLIRDQYGDDAYICVSGRFCKTADIIAMQDEVNSNLYKETT